jgi:hypothetical protein
MYPGWIGLDCVKRFVLMLRWLGFECAAVDGVDYMSVHSIGSLDDVSQRKQLVLDAFGVPFDEVGN